MSAARSPWLVAALLLFLIPGLILVLINFNYSNPASAAADQNLHHLPGIIAFSEHVANPIRNDYSPNIPGYYIIFGAARRWITDSVVGLRLLNLLLSAGLVCTLLLAVSAWCPPALAALLVAPFMFSDSVFPRAIWLNTDNPAWWAVLVLILLALRGRMTPANYVAAGLAMLCAVGIRQNHIWVVPFMLLAAFVGPGMRLAPMAVATAPTLILAAWFVSQWHGFVSPAFQNFHQGLTLSPIPMTFALLAIFGIFYLTVIQDSIRVEWSKNSAAFRRWIIGGLLAGAVAGICAQTSYVPWFRGYGIWLIARATPVFFGRSIVIALLALCGGLVASLYLLVMPKRDRWIFSAAFFSFLIVQCAHSAVFERYYEPFVLMLLALACSRVARRPNPIGPALLTIAQAGFTIWRLSTPASS